MVDATAELVDISEKHWQSLGTSGARTRILVELMKEGGSLLPSALARKIGVTKANISLLLVPLEREGLVSRGPHPEDGRKTVISLTADGERTLLRNLPENRRRIEDRMQVLSPAEQQSLLGLLTKLKNNPPAEAERSLP
ncbi:MarR family winged helix-turn-helix transcriptional regulator [Gorillibacterium sp. sgz500922]|uniref:MarR family winged helix-turn-helix transcriptional regulator n=1 Tax=Gorillibacterium sp. sgz500922 TaxID=3446694 RepID=UPI003F677782